MNKGNDYNKDVIFAFYESEYNHLISVGLYHKIDLNQIKDIIHQLFIDFYERKVDLSQISNPKAYIISSFKRRLIDLHRLNAKIHKYYRLVYQNGCEVSVDHLIEIMEINTERLAMLRLAYEKLPARCQKVIFLKFYEGLSNEEIIVRTGLSLRSVYNNLSEGIKKIRSEICAKRVIPAREKMKILY